MPRSIRSLLWSLYGAYLAWVAYLTLTPSPTLPGGTMVRLVDLASHLGLSISTDRVELLLNIVMLMPLSFLGGLLLRRLRVSDWTALGFAGSLAIEAVQRVALPSRNGSSRDVVANTLGSALGAVFLVLLLGLVGWQRTRRAPRRPTLWADRMTA